MINDLPPHKLVKQLLQEAAMEVMKNNKEESKMKYVKLSKDLTKEAEEVFSFKQALDYLFERLANETKKSIIEQRLIWDKINKELEEKGIKFKKDNIIFDHNSREIKIKDE